MRLSRISGSSSYKRGKRIWKKSAIRLTTIYRLFQDVPNPEISFLQRISRPIRCPDRLAHLPLPLGGGTPGVGSRHRMVDAHAICCQCHRFLCSVNHKSEEVFTFFQDRRKMVEERTGRLQKLQRVCPGVLFWGCMSSSLGDCYNNSIISFLHILRILWISSLHPYLQCQKIGWQAKQSFS